MLGLTKLLVVAELGLSPKSAYVVVLVLVGGLRCDFRWQRRGRDEAEMEARSRAFEEFLGFCALVYICCNRLEEGENAEKKKDEEERLRKPQL